MATGREPSGSPPSPWARAAERGAATVEFALMTVLLVPLLMYAIYLFELARANIKATEASRYLVWEMTVAGLSDWRDAHHAAKFAQAKQSIMSEVATRWSDDLESASPTFTGGQSGSIGVVLRATVDPAQIDLVDRDADVFDVGGLSGLGDAFSTVVGTDTFNWRGKAQGTFRLRVKNVFLGKLTPWPGSQDLLLANELDLTSTQSLIADQWDLKDGKGIDLEIEGLNCESDYCRQVSRVAFRGLNGSLGSVMGPLSSTLASFGNIHWPLSTVVASLPIGEGGLESAHNLDVADPPNHGALRRHYTNAFKDTKDENSSTYNQVHRRLGRYYLGCRERWRQEGQCVY